jgi:hypothetical protein
MVLKTIKIACNDLSERAEELIPDAEGITDIKVVLRIPALTDQADCVPAIHVETDCYVKRIAAEEIYKMLVS